MSTIWHYNLASFILPFFIGALLCLILTFLVRKLALRFRILDYPILPRKIQKAPIPLLGGLAVYAAFVLVVLFYLFFTHSLATGTIRLKNMIGILVGGLFLMIGGILDDKYNLKPWKQFIWPLLAAAAIVASGIGIKYATNPLGGLFYFDQVKIEIFTLAGIPYYLTLFADLFAFFWILGMIYTTKYLDGLDGLASGVTTIGAVILFFLSLSQAVHQPETALLSIICAGVFLGFLVLNFHPAKIFLGEGGSTFAGFMLAVLAILAGGKIATTLLIMGIPILDALWVICRRVFFEHRSPFKGDAKHLHFRLLGIGFTHRQAVLFLCFLSFAFGVSGLFLQAKEKLLALIIMVVVMVSLALTLVLRYRRKEGRDASL
ncbi:MAG: MraY family glycosyltransferase [Candidatus Doudnabacteria bacterium]